MCGGGGQQLMVVGSLTAMTEIGWLGGEISASNQGGWEVSDEWSTRLAVTSDAMPVTEPPQK
jgi:hypothetical protein